MIEDIKASQDWQQAASSPNFADIKQILYLVRDADKLANLHHIKSDNHLEKDLFFRQLTQEALKAPISPVVHQQFKDKQTIRFPTVYSFADRILMVLSWIYDFNYQTTKEIFKNEGYAAYLLNLLSKYHHNTADIEAIYNMINRQEV